MMKKINNDYIVDERTWSYCLFHPKESVIGVCALCLNEKLLILAASKQRHNISSRKALPKVFAITSLLNRFDIKQQKPLVYESSSTSQEDSFISIKFEKNGVASWDKGGKTSKRMSIYHQPETSFNHTNHNKTVVGHTKPRPAMRWRKRIGHLFQLIKRSKNKRAIVQT